MNLLRKKCLAILLIFLGKILNIIKASDCKANDKGECVNQRLKFKNKPNNNNNKIEIPFWEKPFESPENIADENLNNDDENEEDYVFEDILDETINEDNELNEEDDEEVDRIIASKLRKFYLDAKEDRETYRRLESQRFFSKLNQLFQRIKEYFGKTLS